MDKEDDMKKEVIMCSCTSVVLMLLFIWLLWPVQTSSDDDCDVNVRIIETEWFKNLPG